MQVTPPDDRVSLPVKSACAKSSVSVSSIAMPASVVNIAVHVSVVPAQLQPISLAMGALERDGGGRASPCYPAGTALN